MTTVANGRPGVFCDERGFVRHLQRREKGGGHRRLVRFGRDGAGLPRPPDLRRRLTVRSAEEEAC